MAGKGLEKWWGRGRISKRRQGTRRRWKITIWKQCVVHRRPFGRPSIFGYQGPTKSWILVTPCFRWFFLNLARLSTYPGHGNKSFCHEVYKEETQLRWWGYIPKTSAATWKIIQQNQTPSPSATSRGNRKNCKGFQNSQWQQSKVNPREARSRLEAKCIYLFLTVRVLDNNILIIIIIYYI